MSAPPGHMEPTGDSPGKKLSHHDSFEASPGAHPHSKYIGPSLAETVHASEKFDKAGLLAAHLAALHDAHMLERGLLPGSSLPDSEAPPIPPVYADSPWKDFKPLTLADMKVGKTHRRHFLEGRLCSKSLKVTSVVNVLEEDSGLATKIILTNALPARASMAQAQNCYPEGARVTVRDPYLTRFPDGVVGVLVERPNDIAFLSRPESTGENGTRIYGAVGLEGYDNDRVAHSTSREHGDFSRKIHMFEEQMKQENLHFPSQSHSAGHLKPLGHGHRDDVTNSRSSPAKEEPKESSSRAKEEPKEVSVEESAAPKEVTVEESVAPQGVIEESVAPQGVVEESVAPQGVVEESVAPQGVVEESVEPQGVIEESVAPQGVVEESVAPQGVVEESVAPQGVVEESVEPQGVIEESVAPQGVAEESVAPQGVIEESVAPQGVVEESVEPQGVIEESVAPQGVVEESVAPQGVVEESVAPQGVVEESVEPQGVIEESVAPQGVAEESVAPQGVIEESVAPQGVVEESVEPQGVIEESVAPQGVVEESVAPQGVVEESVALQEVAELSEAGASSESGNVVSEEEPSSNTEEVLSAVKKDLPSVSVKEPVIAEAVVEDKELETPEQHPTVLPTDDEPDVSRELPVEEPSQEGANHDEVGGEQGKIGVGEEIQPEESCVEVVYKEEETHLTESVEDVEHVVEEVVSGKEDDTIPTEVSDSCSEQHDEAPVENGELAHEEQSKTTEDVAEPKVPLIRKQFQRSDSLLAVHENEHDSKASAGEWAGESAISEKPATPEHEEREDPDVRERAPSRLVKPASSDKVVETHNSNDLRVLGNLCFGEENYQGAADLYTRSLRLAEDEEKRQGKLVCSREIILGYSNRAEAYIRLQEFDKALADAKKALSRDPSHLKSLFRKGRALLGLSQYEQALSTLQAAAPRAPSDRDLQAALHESSTAVQQSCRGHYDLSHYFLKGKRVGESPQCADYIGPVIVTDVGRGRGRGLVLTKDVEAGELLLVSNPIAFLPLHDVDRTHNDISQAFVNGKVQEGFRTIVETSHFHNKGLEKLPTLYDGEKVLPAPSVNQTQFESASHLDAAHIRRIIQLNAINGDATMGWKNLPGSGEQDQQVEHWGLWWLPSFINHSCLPSSSPILVGKALFVFASRDLRAGDEVTRPYFDIFQPLEQRKELSAKGWGFICYCPRCKLEDALHTSLSKVTEDYVHLMELASQSKAEFGTDEKLSATQTSAALKFFHKLETKLKDFKLNASENNWVRSSFLHYIDMINGDHELHTHLESIVEALVTVCPGSETTLHMAVVAKDSSRRTFGKKSNQFKHSNQRALNICRYTYGKQRLSVLQSIVDKNDYQS